MKVFRETHWGSHENREILAYEFVTQCEAREGRTPEIGDLTGCIRYFTESAFFCDLEKGNRWDRRQFAEQIFTMIHQPYMEFWGLDIVLNRSRRHNIDPLTYK
jgi:hypothetical protein